jgi:putative nucleotidyltransferase with HDIG domain
MRIETTFLHSKLARRIFWLFVLCALVPITVLALVSLRNVSAQLKEQSLRELHQVSRDEAMSIYERLSFLEANLRLVAFSVRVASGESARSPSNFSSGPFSGLASRFDGLEVVTTDGLHRNIFGNSLPQFSFTEAEQQSLRSGRNILSTIPCAKLHPCILLSQALNQEVSTQGILVAEIHSSYLWDSQDLPEAMALCVLDPAGRQLFCSGEAPDRFPNQVTHSFSGQFEWRGNVHDYLAGYWNLPLQSAFSAPHWTIITSEAKPDVLAPLLRFRNSFLLVFLLALWIVLLLSLIQIRRNLVPLAKLKEGTRGISSGDFQTRVAIHSGDEFEELAASFNFMAGRIEKQLKTIKVVDEIDRAILSAWDPARIVGKVCSRLRELLPHNLICVNLFDNDISPMVLSQVFSPDCESPEDSESIQLTPQEAPALWDRREVSVLDDSEPRPWYLKHLCARGMRHFLMVPVISDKGASAVFILGHAAASVWTEEDKEQARHLAAQIAVAFANSQLLTDLEQIQWGTLTALARTIDAKSPWTLGHSERVTSGAIKIAQAMGLPPRELDIMRRGGLLHDIGKIGTPGMILDKPGKLSDEEMKQMREHVNIGVRILQPIPGLAESMSIVSQHHEWVNGGGYPNGLVGDEITLHARIFAVADCFDALISDRPYRPGMPIERVMQILEAGARKQFDPHVLEVFRTIVAKEGRLKGSEEVVRPLIGVS